MIASPVIRSNRVKDLLDSSSSNIQSYYDEEVPYAPSTLRKLQWVKNLYLPFCKKAKIQPFPLNLRWTVSFFLFCAYDCQYRYSSLNEIIRRNIKTLHKMNCSDPLPEGYDETITRLFRSFRHDSRVRKSGNGLQPLIKTDVSTLIQSMHPIDKEKPRMASLFLFAFQTGSRAITCANVRICDLVDVFPDGMKYSVIVNQKVTKGDNDWNHEVKLTGYLDFESPLDFVYYLNQYLRQLVKMDLLQLVLTNKHNKQLATPDTRLLWNLSPDAMRERLKQKLDNLGYPLGEFAFHSFRSGFLCSALLKYQEGSEE